MQVYYSESDNRAGRCQFSGTVGGYTTMAWMELNQYNLGSKNATIKRSVATHELGHGFGFDEYPNYSRSLSIMSQAATNSGNIWNILENYNSPTTEDIDTLKSIY